MGFQHGDRLGQNGRGQAEPIAIDVRHRRTGVGSTKRSETCALQPCLITESNGFLDLRKRLFELKTLQRELDAVRTVCRELDAESGMKHSDSWMADDEPRQNSEDSAALQVRW